jgi:hypothetical protein
MGIVLVAFLTTRIGPGPYCYYDDINPETHQLGRKLSLPIDLPSAYRYSMAMLCPSI